MRHHKRLVLALACVALIAAGGAGVYTLRTSGASSTPGCPRKEDLRNPVIDFEQAPQYYVTVTLTNPNACYGFLDEPMEITLFGPNGRRAISYRGGQAPHGDVGVCCNVTLPPHGTWTIRLGGTNDSQGLEDIRICNIHVEAIKRNGYDVWQRMPDGGDIVGHGSFPPKSEFDPDKFPPLPDDPTWREPCDSPSAPTSPPA